MEAFDLAVINGDVLLPDGQVERLNVGVRDGRIAALTADDLSAEETIDAAGLTVIPGLIDEHFHVFRGYSWETYEGATRAAIKGGVTTVIDMPLDQPPTLTADALREKIDDIESRLHTDTALFGGYLEENPDELEAMAKAGASAFKLFTGGVAPPGMYPGVDDGQLLDALRRVAAVGATATVHSENAFIVDYETQRLTEAGRTDLAAWDEARPWFSELAAAYTVGLLAQVSGARTVVAHVSSPQTVDALDGLRGQGADVWVETCHHYLCGSKEDALKDERLKWNPPTRDAASVDAMWKQLSEGKIHTIGSDHAPLPKDPEASVWEQAPGAGNGVEIMFPVLATEALHRRDIGLGPVVDLMAANPARIFRLADKGSIREGADADLAIIETNGSKRLEADQLEYHEQPKWSPFDGAELKVYPVYTVLRGKLVYADGEVVGAPGDGRILTRAD